MARAKGEGNRGVDAAAAVLAEEQARILARDARVKEARRLRQQEGAAIGLGVSHMNREIQTRIPDIKEKLLAAAAAAGPEGPTETLDLGFTLLSDDGIKSYADSMPAPTDGRELSQSEIVTMAEADYKATLEKAYQGKVAWGREWKQMGAAMKASGERSVATAQLAEFRRIGSDKGMVYDAGATETLEREVNDAGYILVPYSEGPFIKFKAQPMSVYDRAIHAMRVAGESTSEADETGAERGVSARKAERIRAEAFDAGRAAGALEKEAEIEAGRDMRELTERVRALEAEKARDELIHQQTVDLILKAVSARGSGGIDAELLDLLRQTTEALKTRPIGPTGNN